MASVHCNLIINDTSVDNDISITGQSYPEHVRADSYSTRTSAYGDFLRS